MSIEMYSPFVNSVKQIMMQMANIEVQIGNAFYDESDEIVSYGISTIVSCIGKVKGRILLDMDQGLATTVTQNITGLFYNTAKNNMVLAAVSELNNTIAGDGVTSLNNKYSLGLRLAPPIVFTGKDTVIALPKLSSVSMDCLTKYGKMKINIAFERSIEE